MAFRQFQLSEASRLSHRIVGRIYAGEVFVFRNIPELHELAMRAGSMINARAGCAPLDLKLAKWQEYFAPSQQQGNSSAATAVQNAAVIQDVCDVFESNEDAGDLMRDALRRCGVGWEQPEQQHGVVDSTEEHHHQYHVWDRVRLRIQPYGDDSSDIHNTERHGTGPVSYTHLTLPTNREV